MVAFQQTLPSNTCRMPNPGYHIFLKMSDCFTTPAVNLPPLSQTLSKESSRYTDKVKNPKSFHGSCSLHTQCLGKGGKKETVLDQYKIRNTATDTVMQYELTRDELSHQFS